MLAKSLCVLLIHPNWTPYPFTTEILDFLLQRERERRDISSINRTWNSINALASPTCTSILYMYHVLYISAVAMVLFALNKP